MENTKKLEEILSKYPKRVEDVQTSLIVPNPWNPNQQQQIVFESLKKSIQKYGWLQFPVVKDYVGQFQIIDGEHRVTAAKELKIEKVPCLILGDSENEVTQEDAMILTQLLNTRGQDDVLKRAELLKAIKDSNQPDLFNMLPMISKEIEQELELLNFDFDKFERLDVGEEDINRGQKALQLVTTLEKELRKFHSESTNTELRLLIESYFEWAKVFITRVAKE